MKDRAGVLNTRQAGLKQYCKVFHRKNLTVVRLWLGAPCKAVGFRLSSHSRKEKKSRQHKKET